MSRFLAIDWDDNECRYLLASVQKGTVSVQKAGAVSLASLHRNEPSDEDSDEPATSIPKDDTSTLVATLKERFKEEKIGACPTILLLGRRKVEMIYQNLPPSRDSEIPVLLKNQVLRELAHYSDFDPLDYVRLDGRDVEGLKLMALTIPLSLRQTLVRRFRSIGPTLRRIGFRPLAAAGLVLRTQVDLESPETGLLVDYAGNGVDLILLRSDCVVSLRSLRLPDQFNATEIAQRIAEEIERTITVERDDVTGRSISKVFLCGNESDYSELNDLLQKQGIATALVNPFEIRGVVAASIPEKPGRFTALIGALMDEAFPLRKGQVSNRVDFLHPKEAPKPINYVGILLLLVVVLTIAGYALYRWNRSVIRGMEAELANLEKDYNAELVLYRQIAPSYQVLNQTLFWASREVVWLDELRELSAALPSPQEMVVSRISFVTLDTNQRFSGRIDIEGMMKDDTVIQRLWAKLREQGRYSMLSPQTGANPAGGGYPRRFNLSIMRLRIVPTNVPTKTDN